MASCPNCGNYWNMNDPENLIAAEARQRSPIILVEFINMQLDESTKRLHCTACGQEWTGTYRGKQLLEIDQWHKDQKYKP